MLENPPHTCTCKVWNCSAQETSLQPFESSEHLRAGVTSFAFDTANQHCAALALSPPSTPSLNTPVIGLPALSNLQQDFGSFLRQKGLTWPTWARREQWINGSNKLECGSSP